MKDIAFIARAFGQQDMKEDVNHDGIFDKSDITYVSRAFSSKTYDNTADVNGDGKVDMKDISQVARTVGLRWAFAKCDLNRDGKVNMIDIARVARLFGTNVNNYECRIPPEIKCNLKDNCGPNDINCCENSICLGCEFSNFNGIDSLNGALKYFQGVCSNGVYYKFEGNYDKTAKIFDYGDPRFPSIACCHDSDCPDHFCVGHDPFTKGECFKKPQGILYEQCQNNECKGYELINEYNSVAECIQNCA